MPGSRRTLLRTLGVTLLGGLAGCNSTSPANTTTNQTTRTTTTVNYSPQYPVVVPATGSAGDYFGTTISVSRDGSTVVVGAPSSENADGRPVGAAYVFRLSDEGWTQRARLTADDADGRDQFGAAVALSDDGSRVVVGAPGDEDPHGDGAGSTYVFENSNGSWSQQTKLAPDRLDDSDQFGSWVGLSGDGTTAVVGAVGDEALNNRQGGSAFVFERGDGRWRVARNLGGGAATNGFDLFGTTGAVSQDGSTVLLSAPESQSPPGAINGVVLVFDRSDEKWQQTATLLPADEDDGGEFGAAVAVSDDGHTALVGSHQVDVDGRYTGAVYEFTRTSGSWKQTAVFTPPDEVASGNGFGSWVALSGDATRAVVGAANETRSDGAAGVVYAFAKSNDTWKQQARITPPDGDSLDKFGVAGGVSNDATKGLLGAPYTDTTHGTNAGAAYTLDR